jgi:hypothetical protein
MRVQKVDSSTSFKAVNQKYLESAKNQFFASGKVLPDLFQSISYDVFKHKKMPYKDAIDTLKAIKGAVLDMGGAGEALLTTLIKNKPAIKLK